MGPKPSIRSLWPFRPRRVEHALRDDEVEPAAELAADLTQLRNARKAEQPATGRFADGVGTFLGDDVLEGRAIRVRFIWSGIAARSARWEQAFSADGGASWETNWVMNFARMG